MKLVVLAALLGLTLANQPTATDNDDGTSDVDCIDDGVIEKHTSIPAGGDTSCAGLNAACSTALGSEFTPNNCDIAGQSGAVSPLNGAGVILSAFINSNDAASDMYNGGSKFTGYSGALCRWLPNGYDRCKGARFSGDYFVGTHDFTNVNNPVFTLDYSYTSSGAATSKFTVDCGNGVETLFTVDAQSPFRCTGYEGSMTYDYTTVAFPAACANNPSVTLRWDFTCHATPTDRTDDCQWWGMKNLMVVDTTDLDGVNGCVNGQGSTKTPTTTTTKTPTSSPTEPVMLVDNVCELLDIDFFLKTCSSNHNNLVSNLGNNNVADAALTARVTALEAQVASGAANLQSQIDGLQTQLNNLVTQIQTSFQNFVASLGSLGGPAAKSVPVFNEDGQVIGSEELFFTTMQAQWLLVLLIIFNVLLMTGISMYCCMKFIMTGSKMTTKRYGYSHARIDSSDSEAALSS